MSAVLTILGDASGVRRALGEAVGDAKRAAGAMNADARRASGQRRRMEAEEIADARAALRSMMRDRQRAARDRQQAEEAAAKRRTEIERGAAKASAKAAADSAKAAEKAEKARTKTAERESKLRTKIADGEKRAAERAERDRTKQHEREERDRTKATEREGTQRSRLAEREARAESRRAAERRRNRRQLGQDTARGLGTAFSAGAAGARDLHGQYQDARRQRAGTRLTLGSKLVEAGATRQEAESLFSQLSTQALAHGMNADELAGAVASAQTEFSVLGSTQDLRGMDPAQRMRALRERLDATLNRAVQGRNLGADPGEFLRLSGMFSQMGLGSSMDDLLGRTVAMAQRGAIEPGAVTRQAMTPIMQRMQAALGALGPDATPEARAAAARGAYVQSFAELQVLRSRGWNPRQGANAMAALDQSLTGNVTAERMRNNLRVVRQSARGELRGRVDTLLSTGDGGLFEEDPERRGQRRLRAQYRGNAVALSAALASAGLTGEQTANIFAGGGHGNAQALQANWRRLMQSMLGVNAEGVTGFSAVGEMQQATLSQADRDRMADFYEHSDSADLNRNEEARLQALTNNTDQLRALSDRFANWSARNPLATTALETGGGLLGGLAAGFGGRALGWLFGAGSGAAAPAAAATGAGEAATAAVGGTAASGGVLATLGGLFFGATGAAAMGGAAYSAASGRTIDGREMSGLDRARAGLSALTPGAAIAEMITQIPGAIERGLGGARITATVDPHDADHAASRNAGRPR